MDRTELIRTYQSLGPTLVLYARTWLDEAAAQEAVQDAFVAVAARADGEHGPTPSWTTSVPARRR